MSPLYLGATEVTLPGGGGPGSLPNHRFVDSHGTTGIVVTAGGTVGVKGAWTQLIASTSGDADMAVLNVSIGGNGVDSRALLDVALGAVGAEVPIVSDLPVGGLTQWPIIIPVLIPSGSRISIRTACATASRAGTFRLHTYATPYGYTNTTVDIIGANLANYKGTVTSGVSTWTELVSATSQAYRTAILVPSVDGTNNPGNGGNGIYLRAGSGSPGSELELTRVFGRGSNTEDYYNEHMSYHATPFLSSVLGPVASGTRLAINHNATNSICAVVLGAPE